MSVPVTVFCDNEGCLVPGKGLPFPLLLLEQLRRLLERSPMLRFCLCTGRSIPYVEAMTQMLGLTESEHPAICEGGAALYWPLREKQGISDPPAYQPLSTFNAQDFLTTAEAYLPADSFRVELGKLGCLSLYPNSGWTVPALHHCIVANHPDLSRYSVLASTAAVDITLRGVDKASAVRTVCSLMDIPMSRVVCIGDSGNDLPMLEVAAVAACPSNAVAAVKRISHIVSEQESTAGVLDILEQVMIRYA